MGSYEDTCALTNTPVFHGDKCIMLVVSKKVAKEKSFGVLGVYGDALFNIEVIAKGTYDDRGWIKELPTPAEPDNRDDWQHLRSIFFHASAWNLWKKLKEGQLKTIKEQKKIVEEYSVGSDFDEEEKALLAEFYSVAAMASVARRDILSGLSSKGKQEWSEQREAQRLIHEASGRLLHRSRPREDE